MALPATWVWFAHYEPHHSLKLPLLYQTALADPESAQAVIETFVAANDMPPSELIGQLVARHKGNLRLILFDLYDWWGGAGVGNRGFCCQLYCVP